MSTVSERRSSDPRHLSRLFQGELDWIVMKALEKDRTRRYETASALAADWNGTCTMSRSSLPAVGGVSLPQVCAAKSGNSCNRDHHCLALLIVVGGAGWMLRDRATRQAILAQQITQALDETKNRYAAGKLTEAMSAVKRAEGLLASGSGSGDGLTEQVRQWRTDLETVNRLEQIRFDEANPAQKKLGSQPDVNADQEELPDEAIFEWNGGRTAARQSYEKEFRRYAIELSAPDIEKSADRIRKSAIKKELVAALDDWYQITQKSDSDLHNIGSGTKELLEIACRADPDTWRDRLRDVVERSDDASLARLAAGDEVLTQPVPTILLLTRSMRQLLDPNSKRAIEILRQAQMQHPADFWINVELANLLPDDALAEEIGFRRIAAALRPIAP